MKIDSDRVVNTKDDATDYEQENKKVRRATFVPLGIFLILIGILLIINIADEKTQPAINGLLGFFTLLVIIVQSLIIQKQWKAMQDALGQSERQARAAELSADTASDAFRIGEAPYFGITQIRWVDVGSASEARLEIHFLNGGRTPAWHFHSIVLMRVSGEDRLPQDHEFLMASGNMRYSFVPSNEAVAPVFTSISFKKLADVYGFFAVNPKANLTLHIIVTYQDFRGEWQSRDFDAKGGRRYGEDFVDVTADKQREDYEDKIMDEIARQENLKISIPPPPRRPRKKG